MSFKAKDLAYDAREPAFLQRLKAGIASGDSDRHERPIARPKRIKKDEDEDDGPTYVLEGTGESMSKAEYEKFQANQEGGEAGTPGEDFQERSRAAGDSGEDAPALSKKHITEIGHTQRKRKAGKVIAGVEDEATNVENKGKGDDKKPKKAAKKAKTVKLSFEDD